MTHEQQTTTTTTISKAFVYYSSHSVSQRLIRILMNAHIHRKIVKYTLLSFI